MSTSERRVNAFHCFADALRRSEGWGQTLSLLVRART